MGIFDNIKSKCKQLLNTNVTVAQSDYVDASSVSQDEKPFYQPDEYYTYYSYPDTNFARKVITFEKRKTISFPSSRGLYVPEILLLEYCSYGKYPKPKEGYPSFWWFQYGIRDIGHTLESLEKRGFICWSSPKESLIGLKVDELRKILSEAGLSSQGKKSELIERIKSDIPDSDLIIANYIPKYKLTDLGKIELEQNGYVPYMHKHNRTTVEDSSFGEAFNIWSINKHFRNGDATHWKEVVGEIETKLFGVNMAMSYSAKNDETNSTKTDTSMQREEIRKYLATKQTEINKAIQTKGDGIEEELQGLAYKKTGNDKDALVQLYIAIGKKCIAPALYRETSIILRKYQMYEEELSVLNIGLENVAKDNSHWQELMDRKNKVMQLISKSK